jgi:thiamine pyrophosphate-dependent acetolactate synthase large subunit-like protein
MAERILDGGEVLVEVLNNHGVEYIFASPGSEWPPLWEALSRRKAEGDPAPEYVTCRHESLAVGAAGAYWRSTGKLPAVMLHTTVGSLHCATALRGALHEGIPMMVMAGESIGYGEMDMADPGPQWQQELSDIGGPTRLLSQVTKWSATIRTVETVADTFHRACMVAQAAPAGPTFVTAPIELLLQKRATPFIPAPPRQAATSLVDEAMITEVAQLLHGAAHPVVIVESAGRDPSTVDTLVQMAELLALPVVEAAVPSCTNFPTDHPLHQGFDVTPFMAEADVVLLLDSPTPWHPASSGPGEGCTIIDFSPNPERHLRAYHGYRIDISVRGPLGPSIGALAAAVLALDPRKGPDAARFEQRAAAFEEMHRARRQGWADEAVAAKDDSPIDPRWAMRVLNEVIPDDALLVYELISHRRQLQPYMERRQPGESLRSFGGLGQGLPNALGMKIANPDKLVVVMLGDGAFNYNPVPSCFGMCQEQGRPILVILLNNLMYQSQQNSLNHMYPEGYGREIGPTFATSIAPHPDYPKLVEAFGGWGIAIDKPEEIVPAIKQGIQAVLDGKPALVDILLSR